MIQYTPFTTSWLFEPQGFLLSERDCSKMNKNFWQANRRLTKELHRANTEGLRSPLGGWGEASMALFLCSPQRPLGNSLKSAGLGLDSHPRLEPYTRQP